MNILTVQPDIDGFAVADDGVTTIVDADGDGGCSVAGNQERPAPWTATSIQADTGDGDDYPEIAGLTPPTVLIAALAPTGCSVEMATTKGCP